MSGINPMAALISTEKLESHLRLGLGVGTGPSLLTEDWTFSAASNKSAISCVSTP
jgi:hypothetical protein